ncbi:hypothetical protein RIF29_05653 [Crotalaria pallida]|uniref:Diacylglycerol O-acyltransferase n=1 Tax=Crotalaria pallida TaxID=3830 RepID=A0AAN9J2J4_CROPI
MNDFEEDITMPVSPMGQYFKSSVLSVSIISVLEFESPLDDSQAMALIKDVFLPINTRFSSIMIEDKNGIKRWKQVEMNINEHVKFPIFPTDTSLKFYDEYLDEYMTKISMETFPQDKPLWEMHMIKYPTCNAAGTVIFKLHHSLGDGYSLMGALFACLQRADDCSLPMNFPSSRAVESKGISSKLSQAVSLIFGSVFDFGWSLLKGNVIEDDQTPLRSGYEDVELRPITISNVTVSLDSIKEVKDKLKVSTNDVLVGIVFLGIRLYMEKMDNKSSKAETTALVLLNTRNIRGYKSVKDMLDTNSEAPWGNRLAFLHIPIPKLSNTSSWNPLEFVLKASKFIKRQRFSLAVPLMGLFLDLVKKIKGPEGAARYVYKTLKNSSLTISHMIGPVEQVALANNSIKSLYFMNVGLPQSLAITITSYMGYSRVSIGAEKGFIDGHQFKSCLENSFEVILKAARHAHCH